MNKENLQTLLKQISALAYNGWCGCDLKKQPEFIDFSVTSFMNQVI